MCMLQPMRQLIGQLPTHLHIHTVTYLNSLNSLNVNSRYIYFSKYFKISFKLNFSVNSNNFVVYIELYFYMKSFVSHEIIFRQRFVLFTNISILHIDICYNNNNICYINIYYITD